MNQRGFVIPAFLFTPTGVLSVALVAVILYAVIVTKMYGSVHREYAAFRADVEQAQEQIRIDNERKQKEAEDVVKNVSNSWASALDHARRNPVVRVLPESCHPGTGLQAPRPVEGLNAASGIGFTGATGNAPVEVSADRCEELINKGVLDASQVLHLQEYINGICKAYGCE